MDAEQDSTEKSLDSIGLLEQDIKRIDEEMKNARRKRNSEIHKRYLAYQRFKKSSIHEIENMERKKLRIRIAIDYLKGRRALPEAKKQPEKKEDGH